jgi:hypothetical protein
MPTCLAILLSCCRKHIGPALLLLLVAPIPSIAAPAVPAELKRSDTLDMRRAGKVSDDERAVLRIEWRAGLSGVDADRSIQEMMSKLRQMESNVQAVRQALRSMPAEKRAAAPLPVATEEPDAGPDWRLMTANITALILVAVWWSSRRKAQAEAAAVAAKLAARVRSESDAISAVPMPQFSDFPPPPVQAPQSFEPSAFEAANPIPSDIAAAPPREPVSLPPEEPMSTAVPVHTTPEPPQSPIIDFILEEADPATVVADLPKRSKPSMPLITPAEVSSQLKKKNVEPTLQLAEIMLSMGLEQGAAQTLVEYTEANPKHAIYHMLKLLGIYRKRGLHQEFQETAEKLRKNFNIQAEDWATSDRAEAPSFEGFSRVSEHVQSIWDQPEECITYLRHLIEDNRDGARAGFPQSVAEEILMLVEVLKETSGSTQEVA